MKKIRVLKVTFDHQLQAYEIPAFRGAIVDAVGRKQELYHNHNNTDKNRRLHYRYPLIQYRTHRGKPMLTFLENGVDEAHKIFDKQRWEITMKGQPLTLNIDRLDLNQFNLGVYDKSFYLNAYKWQALNQSNFDIWQQMESLTEKTKFLERKLAANIISFAKGINWSIEKRFEVKILEIKQERYVRFKGIKVLTFDVSFKTNIFIPEFIGLGKGASLGFGTVRTARYAHSKPRQKWAEANSDSSRMEEFPKPSTVGKAAY